MKNQALNNGKKLNRKQLRSITGGKKICIDPVTGLCKQIGTFCGEKECQATDLP